MRPRMFCKAIVKACLNDCGVSYQDLATRGHVTIQTVYAILSDERTGSIPTWVYYEMREMCPGIPWSVVECMSTCRSRIGYEGIKQFMSPPWQSAMDRFDYLPDLPDASRFDW